LPAGDAEIDHVQFRFVQEAASRGIPIAAVNIGRLKFEDRCEIALSFLLWQRTPNVPAIPVHIESELPPSTHHFWGVRCRFLACSQELREGAD
jgi:hypothetical protein